MTFPPRSINSSHSPSNNDNIQSPLILQQALSISSHSDSACIQKEDDHSQNDVEFRRCSQNHNINSENPNCDNDNPGMDLRNGVQDYHPSRFQHTELNAHTRNGGASSLLNIRSENNNLQQQNAGSINMNPNSNIKNISNQIFKVDGITDIHNIHNLQRNNMEGNTTNEIILTTNNVNDLTTNQRNNSDYILRNLVTDFARTSNSIGIREKLLEPNLRNSFQSVDRRNISISDSIHRKINLSPVATQKTNNIGNNEFHKTNNNVEVRTSGEMRILKPSPLQAQHISLSSVQSVDSVAYPQSMLYVIPQNPQHDKKFVIIKSEPLETVQVNNLR